MAVSMKLLTLASALLAIASLSKAASAASPMEDVYKGKSITLLIGFGPGGGYDTYARLLARHLQRFVAGEPTIIPQNMPGGGGLTVTNYLYNASQPDGYTIGMFGPFTGLEPLYGNKNARFDITKFTWIGNMDVDAGICVSWHASGLANFADTLKKEIAFGSSGKGSTTTQQVLFLKNMLGSKVRLVLGYQGSNEIRLAMRRGEVGATCGLYRSNAVTDLAQDLKSGDIKILIQFGRQSLEEFGDAVNAYDLLKTDEDKQVADIILRANESARPVAAPPGVPLDRATELRTAFSKTMKDPVFLQDAKRMSLPIHPTGADDVANMFKELYSAPPAVVERAKTIMASE